QYLFVSRTTDNVANAEFPAPVGGLPAGVGVTVLYDSAAPVSGIGFPASLAYQNIATLTGTADDTLTGSGIQEGDIALLDVTNAFWTGSSWTASGVCSAACSPWKAATFVGVSSGAWSYTSISTSTFSTNAAYRLYVRALDRAGNIPGTPTFASGAP